MRDGALLFAVALLGIWIVEFLDALADGARARAPLAPFATIARLHESPQTDATLGSPRWIVGAAIVLPALALAALSLLPLTSTFDSGDADIGIFLALMLLDFVAVIVGVVGWSANRASGTVSLFGAILQLVAYGIVIGFGTIGPAMAAQSLSPMRIGLAQGGALPYALVQPISLALYIAGGLAQTFRAPFALPLADSFESLRGLPAIAFRFGLDLAVFTMMALGIVLFTGVGGGPWWTLLLVAKTAAALALSIPLRRISVGYAGLLRFFWRIAMPIALVNVVLVGVLVTLGVR
ncbi:MAG: hypothetical protein NVS3B16_11270 [Vulcanimicrobiaceae bacterium]